MFEVDNEEETSKRHFCRRSLIFGGVQAAAFGLIGWRLFKLQVVDTGKYIPLAEENRINLQVLAPKRGRILDRRGVPLADNEESFRATLTPALAGDVAGVLTLFRRLVPITAEEAERIVRRTRKQSRNMATVIAADLSFEQVAQINLYAPHLPGIRTEIGWRRRYRQGPAVGHVVGYVGGIDKPSVDDDPVKRLPGMRVGKTGVEVEMEDELRGEGGAQKIEVDARGHVIRNLETVEPKAGADVTLTIDAALQRRVMERLSKERRASCVVIDVGNGEIAVMASTPGYDPADIVDAPSEEVRRRIFTSEEKPMLNRAAGGLYPPGSTFKIVTALAALQAGRATRHEHVTCGGGFDLGNRTFRCWKRSGHGEVDLHRAIKESCDVYFFEMARRLGIETLADTARLMGLGVTYDCGLPHKTGVVPDPDWKRGQWEASWLGGDTLLTGIGQGYVLSTPLQLAVMMARVASGKSIDPTIVKRGGAALEFATLGIEPAHLQAVREGLTAVVNEEGGTGSEAQLGDGAPLVAGKTGTSQVNRASTDAVQEALPWGERDHALFVAYVPADAPRYALATVVEHGGGGGAVAAPLARDIIEIVLEANPLAGPQGAGPQGTGPQGAGPPLDAPVGAAAKTEPG